LTIDKISLTIVAHSANQLECPGRNPVLKNSNKRDKMAILARGTNPKTIKSDNLGQYLTGILYLSPGKLSGKNFCPYATLGCLKACLNLAGRGRMSNVQKGRLRKSLLFLNDRSAFFKELIKDIEKLIRDCEKQGKLPAVRLNGTSDLRWEKIKFEGQTILERFPQVQFYDYTKNPNRFKDLPANYHLTFSYNEDCTPADARKVLNNMGNVAVVFRNAIPKTFLQCSPSTKYKVIDGDKHDLRFLDGAGVIVGLTAKGPAKKDTSGFVVD